MWLLNTEHFYLQSFIPGQVPDYVILSHRWHTPNTEECSFEDMIKTPIWNPNKLRKKQGFIKVQGACDLASRHGYNWIWIDSCCIDKSSSAELQEAINSMWNYYADSNICYVYMADIPDSEAGWDDRFQKSEWFTRAWTLQELIAPRCLEFYAKDWTPIGTKFERYEEIAKITTIDIQALVRVQELNTYTAALKLSWAAHRKATRGEDEAYSLLGLFDINMPLLYGEGRDKAFTRLQEAIFNSTFDHTLFFFRYSLHHYNQPFLADSPTRFCERTDCKSCTHRGVQCLPSKILYANLVPSAMWHTTTYEPIVATVAPSGTMMVTTLPLLDYHDISDQLMIFGDKDQLPKITHVAVLNHTLEEYQGALCLLLCRLSSGQTFQRYNLAPALLPYNTNLTLDLHICKVLLSLGPSAHRGGTYVVTTFRVDDGPFSVEEWKAECEIPHQMFLSQGKQNSEFKIETFRIRKWELLPEVTCLLAHPQNPNSKVLLQLVMRKEIWWIQAIYEVEDVEGIGTENRLYFSILPADRCSFKSINGKRFSVALRRLPVTLLPLPEGINLDVLDEFSSSIYKYQIVFTSSAEGRFNSSRVIHKLSWSPAALYMLQAMVFSFLYLYTIYVVFFDLA